MLPSRHIWQKRGGHEDAKTGTGRDKSVPPRFGGLRDLRTKWLVLGICTPRGLRPRRIRSPRPRHTSINLPPQDVLFTSKHNIDSISAHRHFLCTLCHNICGRVSSQIVATKCVVQLVDQRVCLQFVRVFKVPSIAKSSLGGE